MRKKRDWFMIGLLSPAMIMLTFTIVIPVIVVVMLSMFKYSLLNINTIKWNNFANYTSVLKNSLFFDSFLRTLIYVGSTVLLQFAIGLSMALLLNSKALNRSRSAYRTALFLPWTVPSMVAAVVWMFMYQPQFGVVNHMFGLKDFNLLGSTQTAMLSVIITAVWKQTPLMMIMLLSALQTVPADLYEAASIDGAGSFMRFKAITIPAIMPVIKTVTLSSIITNFQMFVLFFTMTGGGPVRATTTLTIYTYETAFTGYNLGKGSAIGVYWLAFLLIFSILYNKLLSTKEIEY
ncbi:MAG: sugar ABC transporter permease [Eubacteriales bacterium]|nr:sugar ABC transporter permease [Eubacteriales bacterium]